MSERYSAASESGSSTDGHTDTAETKDGKTLPWEWREHGPLTLHGARASVAPGTATSSLMKAVCVFIAWQFDILTRITSWYC